MHIAYSALSIINQQSNNQLHHTDHELAIRYHAYQKVCNNYSAEIAAIQKYIPEWMPVFKH